MMFFHGYSLSIVLFQEGKEYGLSAVVEDYRTRFILPCRLNANNLFAAAQKVQVTVFKQNTIA
jgi:hypothetical protein